MIKPTKDSLLVKELGDFGTEEHNTIVMPPNISKLTNLSICEVLKVGPQFKSDDIEIGTKLLVDRYKGADVKHEGVEYRLLRPSKDVLAVLV